MLRKIYQLGESEVLRKKARRLSKEEILSEEIQQLIEDMKMTMREAPGVGLAAPQIGESIQLAVIEERKERLQTIPAEILKERDRKPVKFHVIINPDIVKKGGKTNYFFEGCLSVENKMRVTPRFDEVEVRCLDQSGDEQVICATGWYARILQHEIDHLLGRVYVDIADAQTEFTINEEFKQRWMNASREDIFSFFENSSSDCALADLALRKKY